MIVAHLSLNYTVQRLEVFNNFVYDASKPFLVDAYHEKEGKHPARPGGKYDVDYDDFIPPQIHKSWSFNKTTWKWEPPIPEPTPNDGYRCVWNEETSSWDQVILFETEPH